MGLTNNIEDRSSKQMADVIAAQTAANGAPVDTNPPATDPPITKKPMGYADGYAKYTEKYGGPVDIEGELVRSSEVLNANAIERQRPTAKSKQVNTQVNQFRNIFGYNTSDSKEDPTFIIYDLYMDYGESPLFNSVADFFNNYSSSMPELAERPQLYSQFVNMVKKIFPGDENQNSGTKRHYINSISGLDLLFKKIVTYPEDVLTFTMSDDITMLAQYISELYTNLVYSYDTKRYLIPDNLLRFNLTVMFKDVREIITTDGKYVNQGISKFAYVLHDCQFDFFNSRNFANDVKVSGFDGGATTSPATLNFNINFKSCSKIMAAQGIDNAIPIDLRARLRFNDDSYERFHTDFDPLAVQKEKTQEDKDYESYREQTLTDEDGNVGTIYTANMPDYIKTKKKTKSPLGKYAEKLKNSFTDEISDVRNVLVNKVKEEVTVLNSKIQKGISDKIFGGLDLPAGFNGLTLSKLNVYYDDPFQAINKVSFLFDRFLDNAVDDIKGRVKVSYDKDADTKLNIYWDQQGDKGTFWNEVGTIGKNAYYGPPGVVPRNSNLYSDNLKDGKEPTGENRHGDTDLNSDGQYNEKYPSGKVQPDGTYNEKYPEGDVNEDGVYNEKYPEGVRHGDGQYNLKFPVGDVNPDGQYNEKYPSGKVQPDGQYNEKYPEGDVNPDGQYNEKYPDGRVQPDGSYNEKYPSGRVQPDGSYNEKYPEGDVQPDGQYNLKFPEGDVQPDGTYNEKYPEGDVQPDGTYHDKEPIGDVYSNDELSEGVKKPSGNVYGIKEQREAEAPKGDLHPDGQYNEKYPKGNLYKKDGDK